jgi:O-succinylbenzoic acid--CoA ligase
MDSALLTIGMFWRDPAPFAAGAFPGGLPELPELRGHVLFETSGSSGTPKWIALSKSALLASAEAVNRHLEVTPHSCWGLALPAHHVGGFGVAARAFAAGCAFREFGRRWDPSAFAIWLAENKVTHSSLVPAQVHDLVTAGIRAPSSLRAIVVGGGHLDAGTGQAARALGWPVLASYGMTEAASQIATATLASLETIYQPTPIPLLPIWQAETSPDQRLRISGPALFSGTLIRKNETNETWTFIPRLSEWHETSDLVTLENRCLTPLGRSDLRVKVLGELVDLEAIERELIQLSEGRLQPGSFVIVAIPDARAEHALVPVFDAAANREIIDAVLSAHARRAPGFQRLQAPRLLENLPRSPLGKPHRSRIAAEISSSDQTPPR